MCKTTKLIENKNWKMVNYTDFKIGLWKKNLIIIGPYEKNLNKLFIHCMVLFKVLVSCVDQKSQITAIV